MMISIRYMDEPWESTFDNILESIPAGSQFILGDTIVPYQWSGNTQFEVSTISGDIVEIYINDSFQVRFTAIGEKTIIKLKLRLGPNYIYVKGRYSNNLILVYATNYATYMKGWAREFWSNIQNVLDDHSNQLNSNFSLRSVEHQISWQQMLPGSREYRILMGKMSVKGMINETGTTRGVDEIATSASNTTVLSVPTQVSLEFYEPSVYLVFSNGQDFGGWEFDYWMPNICAATWSAFIRLANNLDDSIFSLTRVSDTRVEFEYFGTPDFAEFDMYDPECGIYSLLEDILGCFQNLRAWTRLRAHIPICLSLYSGRTFDLEIDAPIGRSHFDGGDLDSGGTFDSCDESDPICDGWVGMPILTLDSGRCLDSSSPVVRPISDDGCSIVGCVEEPYSTILGSTLLSFHLSIPISAFSTLNTY